MTFTTCQVCISGWYHFFFLLPTNSSSYFLIPLFFFPFFLLFFYQRQLGRDPPAHQGPPRTPSGTRTLCQQVLDLFLSSSSFFPSSFSECRCPEVGNPQNRHSQTLPVSNFICSLNCRTEASSVCPFSGRSPTVRQTERSNMAS